MANFRGSFFNGGINDLQRIMQDKLLFTSQVPTILLDQIAVYDHLS